MDETTLSIPLSDARRLLGAASGDAALLYLYLRTGAAPAGAAEALRMPAHRVDAALASLRQLGLWEESRERPIVRRQPPAYTEADVLRATERGREFGLLVGEAQRRLGRVLSTEELKILLSLTDYLEMCIRDSYRASSSCNQRSAQASEGMRQSPRGDRETEPILGPSGRQLRLNCCWKKRR